MSECIQPIRVVRKIDNKVLVVPCNRCPACRTRLQNQWAFRCQQEAQVSACYFFITLTYDDKNLVYGGSEEPSLDPYELRNFNKRLRKRLEYDEVKYRYFSCGEYGDWFDRPHYHILAFFDKKISLETLEEYVNLCWPHGITSTEECNLIESSKYIAKYTIKSLDKHYKDKSIQPPFARMSRKPGIGANFVNDKNYNRHHHTMSTKVVDSRGTPYAMPRYYRDRIFSEEERAILSDETERKLLLKRSYYASYNDLTNKDVYRYKEADDALSFCAKYNRNQFGHLTPNHSPEYIQPNYLKLQDKHPDPFKTNTVEQFINDFENG